MTIFPRFTKCQTTIQHWPRLALKVAQVPSPTAVRIRLLHATITRGAGPKEDGVAAGVEGDEGTKAEAAGKDLDQVLEGGITAGWKWADQTISRCVYGDCLSLLI